MSARAAWHFLAMLFAAASAFVGMAPTEAAQTERMELRKIADDVYVMQNSTGASNAMFVVTPDGVVVWDGDIRTADQVVAGIRRTTDKKIRFYMISHPAGDHATAGWTYREDQPLMIATRTQAKSLAEEELADFNQRRDSNDPRFAVYHGAQLIQPNVLYDGSLTLRFGGLTFILTEEGAAHSKSDVTLYIPEKRIFAMGDLFKSGIHTGPGDKDVYKNFDGGKAFISILDTIMMRKLPVDTYVPGHGVVHIGRGVADLAELRRYFVAIRGEVVRMIRAGKSEQEVVAQFKTPAPFDSYVSRASGLTQYLPLYYRELKAEAGDSGH
jgi:glyoxylase-like metal-dependent hydrolase (beta-lactamase superfamily II)